MKKIIIGIILALLIIALIVAGTFLYQSLNSNYKGTNQVSQSNEYNKEKRNVHPPKIDVLAQQFSTDFMNRDTRHGYHKVSKGMHKDKIEAEFGKSEKTMNIAGVKVVKYGDIGVHYTNHKVSRFFIMPEDVNVQQFRQVHGTRTINYEENTMIYDDNPNNKFSVKVYVGQNGEIKGIESIDQVTDNH
ncbi:MAG: hypothetical protein L0L09_06170 [Staphylococcus equorum]|uniref:hypothetical protein n=1 Tax=Staphylococcus TaxID=1279 RepID=UPI000853CFEB|nr:hypothetical protein [Staphylococcus equorum]MDG0821160.1 hypothetical protein [Staphylococcus equorum]MDG0837931.1 hypothetical protein [Staphylococcus equorum]MDK9870736.1 hypothetical protein [Staphylococcus equorum]MDK9876134.1 hypothetical protein [Staphylococcus equorum]MDN5829287.1 hypothetical protein [Staphylococcus equorum]